MFSNNFIGSGSRIESGSGSGSRIRIRIRVRIRDKIIRNTDQDQRAELEN